MFSSVLFVQSVSDFAFPVSVSPEHTPRCTQEAYAKCWHVLKKVYIGFPFRHEPLSVAPIKWRVLNLRVDKPPWEEVRTRTRSRTLFGFAETVPSRVSAPITHCNLAGMGCARWRKALIPTQEISRNSRSIFICTNVSPIPSTPHTFSRKVPSSRYCLNRYHVVRLVH